MTSILAGMDEWSRKTASALENEQLRRITPILHMALSERIFFFIFLFFVFYVF